MLADTKADAAGYANNKQDNQDLGDDPVASTQTGEAVESELTPRFGSLGLLLPLSPAWPNLTIIPLVG